jgi:hypothetical protein
VLLVIALVWQGGRLDHKYVELNRHQQIEVPTLKTLQQSWSASVTAQSWSDSLSPLPSDTAEVLAPEPLRQLEPAPSSPILYGWVTHYGESYQGGVLGCGTGYYDTHNPDIIAVGPSHYEDWPCGTSLRICGPASCITATRHDACPGCVANVLDLSEAGNELVCGNPAHTCRITVQKLESRVVVRVPAAAGP